MGAGIEKLAIEIEEIANGVYPSDQPQQELLVSKAKKIQQLARCRKTVATTRVETLVYHKCDLHMTFECATGSYRVFNVRTAGMGWECGIWLAKE